VRTGDPELQTCTTQTGCQEGLEGVGTGQLESRMGLAVDSQGDVYVTGLFSARVQKFDPDGGPGGEAKFLLTFGGEVNKTKSEEPGTSEAERNLCTAASGDICQAGIRGTGEGQFELWPEEGNFIAAAPNDDVYVGDVDRIQRFDSEGHYIESIALAGETVQSLAIDRSGGVNDGDLYVARCNLPSSCLGSSLLPASEPNVLRLASNGPAASVEATIAVPNPQALAVDADGNLFAISLFASDGKYGSAEPLIHKFGPVGAEAPGFPFSDGFDRISGIAATSACGIAGVDLYVPNILGANSFVRAYGPPPDPTLCPPPVVPPSISDQYATSVQSSGATLRAKISPEFWTDTRYFVQYGTGKCSEGGCDQEQPLAPGSKLTSQVTNKVFTTPGLVLGGLQPATTYHYRFVAESSGGGPVFGVGGKEGTDGAEGTFTTFPSAPAAKTDCPNQAFRTEASAKLPDCRAYEMVSPVDKNGGDVSFGEVARGFKSPHKSSTDGNRFAFSSLRPFADPNAAPLVNQYLAARGADGWSTQAISPPRSSSFTWPPGLTGQFKAFDDNLCEGWLLQDNELPLAPGAPAGVASIYKRDYCDPGSGYDLLTPVDPPGFGFEAGEIEPEYYVPNPQGFSADESHTVIRVPAALTPDACTTAGINQVYLSSEEGPLRLVSALPNGKATCTNSTAGRFQDSVDGFRDSSVVGAISADGSKVFWTDTRDPRKGQAFLGEGEGDLYLRRNATAEQSPVQAGSCTDPELACTVAIDKSGQASFWGADPQGTKAIYSVPTVFPAEQLFEYDVEAAKSKLIAKGVVTGVTGVTGVSEDLSRVYFISTEALTGEQENSEGDKAQAGARNLYLHERGVGIVFVASLLSQNSDAVASAGRRTSRVSPDGLHLAFISAQRLSDYDNTDLAGGKPAVEIYLYDADGSGGPGELRCVSCNPSGSRPRGRNLGNSLSHPEWTAATIPGWTEQLRPTRLLSSDGNRLYFESYDDLLPRDSNGKVDVYEWERASGEEACKEAGADLYASAAGGCLSLISSGQSPSDSELIDASQGGSDVFFTTGSSLLPQDPGLVDVYDAREGGGYPPPPKPPAICEGDACQGAISPPNDPTPASSSFEGAGNLNEGASSRCPKGKHKAPKGKKSRCVSRKPNSKQHAKAHQKRTNDKRRTKR
ncbi:MAG TPA: hypothetical protein VNS60_10615, partial [Solirubrobacterales bacterium]|nr:hypothetical protein [Solirubrobacterales bacterium]